MRSRLDILLRSKTAKVISVLFLASGGYLGYRAFAGGDGATRYVLAAVERGTLVSSVSGSGQVAASNQVEIKSKVSGDVVSVNVKNGGQVQAGTVLLQLDVREARKAVRDAEVNLGSARLALQRIKEPPDSADLTQAENALAKARLDREQLGVNQRVEAEDLDEKRNLAAAEIVKKDTDRSAAIVNVFADLPAIVAGLRDILSSRTVNGIDENHSAYAFLVKDFEARVLTFEQTAVSAVRTARERYEGVLGNYQRESAAGKPLSDALAAEVENALGTMVAALGATNNFLDLVQDVLTREGVKAPALLVTHQSLLDSLTAKANSQASSTRTASRALADARQALADAQTNFARAQEKNPRDLALQEQAVKDKEVALDKLRRGPSALDIASQELAVTERVNALADTRERLADYAVRAPFDGVVADLAAKNGDPVASGAALGTLITKQKIAEISLNEVDVVKVTVAEKATLTFDALPDLSIAGELAEIDTIGKVSQGVVTYTVKIGFDTQPSLRSDAATEGKDDRVKPGMSVSAAIITQAKPGVLLVPNSAVKSQGGMRYVETVEGEDRNSALAAPLRQGFAGQANASGVILKNAPRRQAVEVGAASDEFTEILNGLKEGDRVVIRTIQPSAQQPQTQQQGGLRIPGLPGGGGGRFRR